MIIVSASQFYLFLSAYHLKHESASRRFQPGEGPSRGLLCDYEPSDHLRMELFEAKVSWGSDFDVRGKYPHCTNSGKEKSKHFIKRGLEKFRFIDLHYRHLGRKMENIFGQARPSPGRSAMWPAPSAATSHVTSPASWGGARAASAAGIR